MREYKGYRAGYVTVAQTAYMLNDHIEEVISYLGLSGSRQGDSLWIRNPTRNDHNPSLQIRLKGESKGKWKDQATDDRGDALSLLCYIRGIDNKEAMPVALSILGISRDNPPPVLPQVKVRDQEMKDDYAEVQESKWAKEYFFLKSTADVLGSPVDAYLQNRGIDLRKLLRIPESLRYCAEAYSAEDQKKHPAMVWLYRNKDGLITGAHTTYLEQIGGVWKKARLKTAKRMNGTTRFSFISLARGETAHSLSQPNHGTRTIICEGIETGLSLALAYPQERVIAAGSVSNIKNIRLPPDVVDVCIAMDNDGENAPSLKAYIAAAEAFRNQGKTVYRLFPKHNFGDFNDWLNAAALPADAVSDSMSEAAGEGGDDVPF